MSTVKNTRSKPYIHDLRIHLCANGAEETADLEESCSPVCLADSLRITIALATSSRLCSSLADAVNAYQRTMLNEEQMSCIFPPPFLQNDFKAGILSCSFQT